MTVVKCPECGSRTFLRTSFKDDSRYYVCINYPDCRGKVPVEGGILTDMGGERSIGKLRLDNLRRQRDESSPKGMVPVDEPPSNIWNKENYARKPAPNPPQHRKARKGAASVKTDEFSEARWPRSAEVAEDRTRRMKEHSYPDGEAGRAVRNPWKDEREWAKGADRPMRKRGVAPDSSWGNDWGDDSIVPKAASGRPLSRKPSEDETPGGEKKPSVPRRKAAPKAEAPAGKKETAVPRSRKSPKREAVPEKKRPSISRRRRVSDEKIAPKERKSPESQLRTEAEEDAAFKKRRRNLIVIIIALVVAFLAIDGMIYAAVILRSQGT